MMKWQFLIIDSNEAARTRLVGHLKGSFPGCKLHHAATGENAVKQLKEMENLPVMVFFAHNTPEMNSISFLGHSRQLGTKTNLPTAIVAKGLGSDDVLSLYRLGASVVIERPTQRHEVREAVRDFARVTVRAA